MTIRIKVTEETNGGAYTERDLTLEELFDLLTGNPPSNGYVTLPYLQSDIVKYATTEVPVVTGSMLAVIKDGLLAFYQPASDGALEFSGGNLAIGASAAVQSYTPQLTNVANLDGSTAYTCGYLRVGNVITVYGRVDVDPTDTATLTQLGIELPEPSALLGDFSLAGVAFASGIAGQGAAIRGDPVNDRAEMIWISGDVTNQPMYFQFSYTVMTES